MRDPLEPRIDYLIVEWRRQADEIDQPNEEGEPIDLDEAEQQKAETLRHCADVLAEAVEHARQLR